jgi:hypothetical protein
MPLHLLSKKSWNVYSPQNLARVALDERLHASYQAALQKHHQDHEAAKRAAALRGLSPPRTPTPPPEPNYKAAHAHEDKGVEDVLGREGRLKRRRLEGEDETDRDIRVAKAVGDAVEKSRDPLHGEDEKREEKRRRHVKDAPLYDEAGHMTLFSADERAIERAKARAEKGKEDMGNKRDTPELTNMRFADAAGRNGIARSPWYAAGREDDSGEISNVAILRLEDDSKDAWGRPDPNRKARQAARTSSSDPLAFMKSAQAQLKQAERDRKSWTEQRLRDEQELKEVAKREKLRRRHRREIDRGRRESDEESLEGFSLEASSEAAQGRGKPRSSEHRYRHRRRSRSRSRGREEHNRPDDLRHSHRRHKREHKHHDERKERRRDADHA